MPVTFLFHSFFSSLARYWSLFDFFEFYPVSIRYGIFQDSAVFFFFFLFTIIRSGRLAEIRWSVFTSKSQRILCVLLDGFWILDIRFVHIVEFKLLAQFPVDHLAHTVVSSLHSWWVFHTNVIEQSVSSGLQDFLKFYLISAVICMVLILPQISFSSSPFSNFLRIGPSEVTTTRLSYLFLDSFSHER